MTHAFWLALMGVMNFIGLINCEDVIRTVSIIRITVVTAAYPNEREQTKFSLAIM